MLEGTNLRRARLAHADLTRTVLHRAELEGALLEEATFGRTVLAGCPSLARALGLERISHTADSSIDRTTLAGPLPAGFLEGLGVASSHGGKAERRRGGKAVRR
jgi:hypothetical protein